MNRTYIYRSPICGWTLEVRINKRKKTIRNQWIRSDYIHASEDWADLEFEKWIDGIAEDLDDEGLFG